MAAPGLPVQEALPGAPASTGAAAEREPAAPEPQAVRPDSAAQARPPELAVRVVRPLEPVQVAAAQSQATSPGPLEQPGLPAGPAALARQRAAAAAAVAALPDRGCSSAPRTRPARQPAPCQAFPTPVRSR